MRSVRFELLRPQEILEEKKRFPVVYLPIGPLEWHGPHLAVGMDPLNAEAVSIRAAMKTGGVVLPTFYWGTERERSPEMLKSIGFKGNEWIVGMDFPANSMPSFYVPEGPFAVAVREYLRLLVKQQYKLIVIVNGHGGENHVNTLKRLVKEFTAETCSKVIYTMAIVPEEGDNQAYGHATETETSILSYIYPEGVDISALPPENQKIYNLDYAIVDGATFDGNPTSDFSVREDPRRASAEKGERIVKRSAKVISELVENMWKEIQGKSK
jgi:creatinine amidohydrolase